MLPCLQGIDMVCKTDDGIANPQEFTGVQVLHSSPAPHPGAEHPRPDDLSLGHAKCQVVFDVNEDNGVVKRGGIEEIQLPLQSMVYHSRISRVDPKLSSTLECAARVTLI